MTGQGNSRQVSMADRAADALRAGGLVLGIWSIAGAVGPFRLGLWPQSEAVAVIFHAAATLAGLGLLGGLFGTRRARTVQALCHR